MSYTTHHHNSHPYAGDFSRATQIQFSPRRDIFSSQPALIKIEYLNTSSVTTRVIKHLHHWRDVTVSAIFY